MGSTTDDLLIRPVNFGVVDHGVYRSGYPTVTNLPFMQKLNLRSIIYLCSESYPDANAEFLDQNKIKLHHFGIEGNRDPTVDIPDETISNALEVLLDARHHPILIHCNRGKHRTGCLVGCLRKIQNWTLASILDEYRRFAGSKERIFDLQFISRFDISRFTLLFRARYGLFRQRNGYHEGAKMDVFAVQAGLFVQSDEAEQHDNTKFDLHSRNPPVVSVAPGLRGNGAGAPGPQVSEANFVEPSPVDNSNCCAVDAFSGGSGKAGKPVQESSMHDLSSSSGQSRGEVVGSHAAGKHFGGITALVNGRHQTEQQGAKAAVACGQHQVEEKGFDGVAALSNGGYHVEEHAPARAKAIVNGVHAFEGHDVVEYWAGGQTVLENGHFDIFGAEFGASHASGTMSLDSTHHAIPKIDLVQRNYFAEPKLVQRLPV